MTGQERAQHQLQLRLKHVHGEESALNYIYIILYIIIIIIINLNNTYIHRIIITYTIIHVYTTHHCAKSLLYDSVYLCVYLRNAQNIPCVVYLKCTTAYI